LEPQLLSSHVYPRFSSVAFAKAVTAQDAEHETDTFRTLTLKTHVTPIGVERASMGSEPLFPNLCVPSSFSSSDNKQQQNSNSKHSSSSSSSSSSKAPTYECILRRLLLESPATISDTVCMHSKAQQQTWLDGAVSTLRDGPSRCAVFTDLWRRGFFISTGLQFGGDFLVYHGDPNLFHSSFIVVVANVDQMLLMLDFVSLTRLGTAVNKNVLIAGVKRRVHDPARTQAAKEKAAAASAVSTETLLRSWGSFANQQYAYSQLLPMLPPVAFPPALDAASSKKSKKSKKQKRHKHKRDERMDSNLGNPSAVTLGDYDYDISYVTMHWDGGPSSVFVEGLSRNVVTGAKGGKRWGKKKR
jgi:tRNA-intron lyase